MDGMLIVIWAIRLLFLALLYIFLARVVRSLLRDLRAAAREPGASLGRLVVIESPGGDPEQGRSFDLDAITTLGRDVNNAIVVEDPFASADHAVLTYRGRSWYVEDLGSTNGTFVNGRAVASVSPLGFGDELAIGQVRMRLERARAGST
jgi:FHA domain